MNVIPKKVLRIYKVHISVLLFIFFFGIFHQVKPSFAYLPDGSYRPFGVGYKHKTVIPIWLVAIMLSVLSYLMVLYMLVHL